MAAFSPAVLGAGSELTPEEWLSIVVTPLEAQSVIMSMPGVNTVQTDHALHIPRMTEPAVDSTIWAAPNASVAEFEGATSELVIMDRTVKALKVMMRISNESMRSSDALTASQLTIVNLLRKQVDAALLQGNSTAGITGLIPQAGTTVKHSRFVTDGVTSSRTTVTSATAAFTAPTLGRS